MWRDDETGWLLCRSRVARMAKAMVGVYFVGLELQIWLKKVSD